MARILLALLSGLVFGVGLVVSQMIVPEKVLGFLDLYGTWDPSLAFVMGGAILVSAPAFALARRMGRPLAAPRFEIPTRRDIDARLLSGAAIFGLGWGLVGLCPGPALAAIALSAMPALVFVAAMMAGMLLFRLTLERGAAPSSPAPRREADA
ncbi:YeeE/YedE family protein [Aureimonas ureilytica]|uniref:YeeE/YedE family protein n=1 Tax=Aureimonas ureilytica TaxID=401562 RepID=UPI00037B4ACC|nr:YeeE/YedE family protein [Aureimonas ureilytica]